MNPAQKKRNESLNAIGRELDDLCLSGRLDFDSFKSLFLRALAAAGQDTDDLEMFTPVIAEHSWYEWMTAQLRRNCSRRVA